MDKVFLLARVRDAVKVCPEVITLLSPRARYVLMQPTPYKTYDFFRSAIIGLVEGVYQGLIGGVFIDTLANLISGQLTDAYQRAWMDDGNFGDLPDYLTSALEDAILQQYEHVDQYYRDIVDARVDGTPIAPLLLRADMWANRYKEAQNEAMRLIAEANGGRLMWLEGDTLEKCDTCLRLNGIVAYAREWNELGVHPQGGPNELLLCGGWNCGCSLVPTEQRRSPKAMTTIMDIVSK